MYNSLKSEVKILLYFLVNTEKIKLRMNERIKSVQSLFKIYVPYV
jgi:hypothetical protein